MARRGYRASFGGPTACGIASRYDLRVEAIATAWIIRHPARMQLVLGTANPERLIAAAQGADIVMTKSEWYELYRAAGHLVL